MKLHKNMKKKNLDLCISGSSSPCKSPTSKTKLIDLSNLNFSINSSTNKSPLQVPNRWYIRGHKFTAIHDLKKPRPVSVFHIAGKTHSGFTSSSANPTLLLKKRKTVVRNRKNQCPLMSVCITKVQKSCSLPRKNSSKTLQVDPEELLSWIN